jgi:hypothetical protein
MWFVVIVFLKRSIIVTFIGIIQKFHIFITFIGIIQKFHIFITLNKYRTRGTMPRAYYAAKLYKSIY